MPSQDLHPHVQKMLQVIIKYMQNLYSRNKQQMYLIILRRIPVTQCAIAVQLMNCCH